MDFFILFQLFSLRVCVLCVFYNKGKVVENVKMIHVSKHRRIIHFFILFQLFPLRVGVCMHTCMITCLPISCIR